MTHQTNYTDIDHETSDRLSISVTVICPKKFHDTQENNQQNCNNCYETSNTILKIFFTTRLPKILITLTIRRPSKYEVNSK